jgi:hypothetical protein
MTQVRQPGRITMARLQGMSRARLERQLGLVRDDMSRACHPSIMARHHPCLLAVCACTGSAIAVWMLITARRRPLPHTAVPAPAADGSWAGALGNAVVAIYRLWAMWPAAASTGNGTAPPPRGNAEQVEAVRKARS